MDHLWLLTEERPKPSVVLQIIKMYCKDFDDRITLHNEIKILPHIKDGVFQFVYEVEGLKVSKADTIFIKTVSGNSSFLDFLLFKQERAPVEGKNSDHLIMAIEETKTSDDESRNTGVYQRGSKFVYITPLFRSSRHTIKMSNCICFTMMNWKPVKARNHLIQACSAQIFCSP